MNRIAVSIFLKHFCEKREREGERDFSLRKYHMFDFIRNY